MFAVVSFITIKDCHNIAESPCRQEWDDKKLGFCQKSGMLAFS